MCGIAAEIIFESQNRVQAKLPAAVWEKGLLTLRQRGPDHQAGYEDAAVRLGHLRLSIIDTSPAAHQPMTDPTQRYWIVFNGEIFNYQLLRAELIKAGVVFRTGSDTEVLLHLLIRQGAGCLERLNGFFAFIFYDKVSKTVLLARDRYGIKPLCYSFRSEIQSLWVASDCRPLLQWGVGQQLDPSAISYYFQLNYLPPTCAMLAEIKKLPPGHYLVCNLEQPPAITPIKWYELPIQPDQPAKPLTDGDYEKAKQQLFDLLEDAVRIRLIADVPLGVFLSGGVDSSIIAALTARHSRQLQTFSIGFTNPLYDETKYAQAVADHIKSEHTVFTLRNEDLYAHLFEVLDGLDEPFADASAINFYILSKKVKPHITVALSGDGADEIFGGYQKHSAELRARGRNWLNWLLRNGSGLLSLLPANRHSALGKKIWQLQKYARALRQSPEARYRNWLAVQSGEAVNRLLRVAVNNNVFPLPAAPVAAQNSINEMLWRDTRLVLGGDMLVKGDRMSMAASLEVRTPFLDYRVVDYAFGLPADFKLKGNMRKRILQDTFRPLLPEIIYQRPKQGFEVPLRDWFCGPLAGYIKEQILNKEKIISQQLFNYSFLEELVAAVRKGGRGKEDWTLWAVIVFQHWYDKYIASKT